MMTFAQCWCHYTSSQAESTSPSANAQESMNLVFANQDDEEAIYPLTTREIADAQKHDPDLNKIAEKGTYTTQLVENTDVLCKNGKMVIPSASWDQASRRNNSSLNVLERSKKDSPITCQKMS